MNKKMKMTALLLVGLMSLSTMVGCSTDKAAQEGESTANGKQESTSDATNSDEPVNLVWWTIGNEPKDYQMVSDAINEYTKELFKLGTSTYLEVLSAEQSLLSARLSQVNDTFDRMQAVVSLYQALGGGRED